MRNKIVEEKYSNVTYSEQKLDLRIFRKKSNAKTPSGLVLSHAKKHRKDGNMEYAIYLQELYKQIINLEKSEKVRLESWRGKSGMKFVIREDRIIIIKYKKDDKGEKAKEQESEILREEINVVIYAMIKIDKDKIKTSEIAEKVYNQGWKSVFSDRKKHIRLVEILNFLEYKGWIKYSRRGVSEIIKPLEIQKVLKEN